MNVLTIMEDVHTSVQIMQVVSDALVELDLAYRIMQNLVLVCSMQIFIIYI